MMPSSLVQQPRNDISLPVMLRPFRWRMTRSSDGHKKQRASFARAGGVSNAVKQQASSQKSVSNEKLCKFVLKRFVQQCRY